MKLDVACGTPLNLSGSFCRFLEVLPSQLNHFSNISSLNNFQNRSFDLDRSMLGTNVIIIIKINSYILFVNSYVRSASQYCVEQTTSTINTKCKTAVLLRSRGNEKRAEIQPRYCCVEHIFQKRKCTQ